MSKQKPKFINRFSLFLFFVIFGITFSNSYFEAEYFYEKQITLLNSQVNESSNRTKQIIDSRLQMIDLYSQKFFENIDLSNNILNSRAKIEEYFARNFDQNLGVFQQRILDENGAEIIRVDYKDSAIITPQNKLQDKSSRDYVQMGFNQPYLDVGFSSIDLNIEHGEIEKPYKPTVRSMIKFENFGKDYILVINFDLTKVLSVAAESKLYDIFLVEPYNLQINFHQNPNYFFAKQLNRKVAIQDIYTANEFIKFKKLYKLNYQLCQTIKPIIKKEYHSQMIQSIILWGIVSFFLALLLAFIFSKVLGRLLFSLQERVKEILKFQNLEILDERTYHEVDLIYLDIKDLAKKQKFYLSEVENKNTFIQSLLDSSEEKILIFSNRFELVWANFQALNFFDCPDVNNFDIDVFFKKCGIDLRAEVDELKQLQIYREIKIGTKFIKMYAKTLENQMTIVNFHDITDQVNEKMQALAVFNAQESIIIVTNMKKLLDANRAFFDIFGFDSLSEFRSRYNCLCDLFIKKDGLVYLEDDLQKMQWFESIKNNNSESNKVCMLNRFGEERIYKILTPKEILDDKMVVVFVDITKLEKQNEIIKKSARFSAMGEMIAMIAHQWRQPLAKISTIMATLDVKVQLGALDMNEWSNSKNKTSDLLKSMSNSIQNFLNFFKDSKIEKNVNLIDIFDEQFELLTKEFNIDVDFSISNSLMDPNGVTRSIQKSKFEQAIFNILKNSFEQFEINKIQNPKIKIIFSEYLNYFVIDIIDNGDGVDGAILDFIFDPYFSTKSKNETGLGLYFTKIIIEAHIGGKIFAENLGDGLDIKIQIPFDLGKK